MTTYKCENCRHREASHFHETVRRRDGSGTIMTLCTQCRVKLLRLK